MKKITVFFLAIALIGLMGCGKKDDNEVVVNYTKGVVSFEEVYGYDRYNNSKELGTIATAGNVTYYFAAGISQENAEQYVSDTNGLILHIEEELGITNRNYKIYVCDQAYVPTVEGGILYTTYSQTNTVDYVHGIVRLICGNRMNYGLSYGYAASFGEECGFDVNTDGLVFALKLRETNPTYLDMNYACFNEHYVAREDIEKLQVIATAYYAYLEEHEMTDVIRKYSPKKHREYFNAFLKANGVEAYDNAHMDDTFVYAGGNGTELIWEDAYATYYLEKGFEPSFLHKLLFEEDMLNSGYENLREIIINYRKQLKFMYDKFSAYDGNIQPVQIAFTESGNYTKGHAGRLGEEYIEVYSLANLQQMYIIDWVDANCVSDSWLESCVCQYYIFYPGNTDANYMSRMMQVVYEKCMADPAGDPEQYAFYRAVEEHLGRMLDYSNREESIYELHAEVMNMGLTSMPQDNDNSMVKVSFAFYLTSLVGEETAIKAMLSGDAESAFGKSWDELVVDWENYLRTEFAWAAMEE